MVPELRPVVSRAELKLLAGLCRRRERRASGLLLVEGATMLCEALEAGLRPRLVAATTETHERHAEPVARAVAAGAREVLLEPHQAARASDTEHGRGLLAAVEAPETWTDLWDKPWTARWPADGPLLVPVLWGLQDPGNVGTLLRSARAFGAAGCLLATGSADPQGPKAVRASAGAAFHLPCGVVTEAAELQQLARGRRAELCVAVPPSPRDPADAQAVDGGGVVGLPSRCLLVLGHETRGVPSLTEARRLSLPQAPGVDSLNVGVAGSVLMADWFRAHPR